MKKSTDYQKSFSLLLIGEPKSGKSTFLSSLSRVYICDLDKNLSGLANRNDFYYDSISTSNPVNGWKQMISGISEALKSNEIDTIAIDGLTHLGELAENCVVQLADAKYFKNNPIPTERSMQMSLWEPFRQRIIKLITSIRSDKNLILASHEVPQLAEDGSVISYRPSVRSRLQDTIAGYFTDCWRTYTKKNSYFVRVKPQRLYQIGASVPFDQDEYDVTGWEPSQYQEKFFSHFSPNN